MKFVRRKNVNNANISMINLIDIIFVLLIFFMITTTFKVFSNFDIKLPQSNANFDKDNKKNIEILYTKDEQIIYIENKNQIFLTENKLKEKLILLHNELKKNIKLSADETLAYGKIINLISILKESNIQNVELNIEKKVN